MHSAVARIRVRCSPFWNHPTQSSRAASRAKLKAIHQDQTPFGAARLEKHFQLFRHHQLPVTIPIVLWPGFDRSLEHPPVAGGLVHRDRGVRLQRSSIRK